MKNLDKTIFELIQKTSTQLPADVLKAIKQSAKKEKDNDMMKKTYDIILENVEIAEKENLPLCQDTGTLHFYIFSPPAIDRRDLIHEVQKAVKKATNDGYLRSNVIESFKEENVKDNYSQYSPIFHFEEWDKTYIDIILLMKGGGADNVSSQHSLPDTSLSAERNLDGIKKCIMHSIVKTQGRGCAPGILGIAIGGDRSLGYSEAQKQFLRKMDEDHDNKKIAKIESEIMEQANSLGIGAMGLGGDITILGANLVYLTRHPASFFVTISYSCWALRRQGIRIDRKGELQKWLY